MARAAAGRAPEPGPLERWLARLPMLRDLAATQTSAIVACSGGADSLALLALAASAGVAVHAVHVDHGLRVGSDAEFAVVERAARRLGVAARTVRVDIEPGSNLEARARDARYAALDAARVEAGAELVLVAHTADDQAETVLLNLLRGAATAGLAAMAPQQGTVMRPLLGLRRADTVEVCARMGFAPVVDPMNADLRYQRVWLRREALPALEAGAGRDLRALLARQADVLRDESDLLDALASQVLAAAGDPPRVDVLDAAEPALARRALRQWIGDPPLSLAAIDALMAVVRRERLAVELPGGRRVTRGRGCLLSNRSDTAVLPVAQPVAFALPGAVEGLGVEIDTWIEGAAPAAWPDGIVTCVVDADVVGATGWLRPPGAGERFAPLGLRGTTEISRIVASRWTADPRVVATDPSGGVVWVVGYRIDDRVRVTASTRRFLWMTVSERVVPLGPS